MNHFMDAFADEITKTAATGRGLARLTRAALRRAAKRGRSARSAAARGAGLKRLLKVGAESGDMPGYEGSGGTAYHSGRWGGHSIIDRKATEDKRPPIYKKEAADAPADAAASTIKKVIHEARGRGRAPKTPAGDVQSMGVSDPAYGAGQGLKKTLGKGKGSTHMFMQD